MSKTTLNEMARLVQEAEPFEGNSVSAKWIDKLYCVFSYGSHFPMYVFDGVIGEWIANNDKYSSTTSRHQSKCKPNNVRFTMNTHALKEVISCGGFMQYKLIRDFEEANKYIFDPINHVPTPPRTPHVYA